MKNTSQVKKNQKKFMKKRNFLKVKIKGRIIITTILESQEREEEVVKKTYKLKMKKTKPKKKNLQKKMLEKARQVKRLKIKKVDFGIL